MSSGIAESTDDDSAYAEDGVRLLAEAQAAKYRRLLDRLELDADARVLEIGCGWSGFAETAARAGHRVPGISLSCAQTSYARERVTRAG